MNPDRTIHVGGQAAYTIRFTQNALFQLEQQSDKSLAEFMTMSNVSACQWLLWAGLEGARKKHKLRSTPYTLDEVGDIIDDAGGAPAVVPVILDAIGAAFPQPKANDPEPDPKNAPEESGTGTAISSPASSSV
jgi:hypothetical protein